MKNLNKSLSISSLLLLSFLTAPAQEPLRLRLVRVGYLHSAPLVDYEPKPVRAYLAGVQPLNSLYAGAVLSKSWSRWVDSRLEFNYQRKGLTLSSLTHRRYLNEYHYLGLTPTIGFRPIRRLGFYAGPEVNLLIGQKSLWKNQRLFEVGIACRFTYEFQRIGVSLGAMRAFTPYDDTGVIPGADIRFIFTNTNWQAGLTYRIRRN